MHHFVILHETQLAFSFICISHKKKGVFDNFWCNNQKFWGNPVLKKKSYRATLLLCNLMHRYAISSALLNVSWLKHLLALGKHGYNCHRVSIMISYLGLTLTCQQSQSHHSYTHVGYLKSEVSSICSKSGIPWQQRDSDTSSDTWNEWKLSCPGAFVTAFWGQREHISRQ